VESEKKCSFFWNKSLMAVFLADFFEEKKVDVKKMCFFRMLMG
jgi:hypothetical protein